MYRQRVRRGIKRLVERGYEDELGMLTRENLRMDKGDFGYHDETDRQCGCVLANVFGDYARGLDRLGIPFAVSDNEKPSEFGFTLPPDRLFIRHPGWDEINHPAWTTLRDEWLDELERAGLI